jgi:uncharacterized protein YjbI with pentapeptide repeats
LANPAHLGMLRQGVEAWNRWRVLEHFVRPDLSDADLHGAHLAGANLSDANLQRADLHAADLARADLARANLSQANLAEAHLGGADFQGANLRDTDLYRADLVSARLHEVNLSEAHLHGADLTGAQMSRARLTGADLHDSTLKDADLSGADLRGAALGQADLRGAILVQADLIKADFQGVDLSNAQLGWTLLGDVDLGSAKGLESVSHLGPSTVGIDTVYRSECRIPESFLRGAGVPEGLITYVCSLSGQTARVESHFISYSEADRPFAERLQADLRRNGIPCWLSPRQTESQDTARSRLTDSARVYDRLLLVLSEHSIASDWLEQEVTSALSKEHGTAQRVLFPVRVDDAATDRGPVRNMVSQRHVADFRGWEQETVYQGALSQLLAHLEVEDNRPSDLD